MRFIRAYVTSVNRNRQEMTLSSSDEEGQIQQLEDRIRADRKILDHLRRKRQGCDASNTLTLVMENLVTEA